MKTRGNDERYVLLILFFLTNHCDAMIMEEMKEIHLISFVFFVPLTKNKNGVLCYRQRGALNHGFNWHLLGISTSPLLALLSHQGPIHIFFGFFLSQMIVKQV